MRELIQAEQALGDYTRKHARHIIAGELGNNAGTVDHPTRTNFVYVKLHGDDNQVVEAEAVASFPHQAGIIVAVELVKRNAASRYQVLGIASNIMFVGSIWAGTVGEHAEQHQRRDLGQGGFDPLDIYNRALVNLRGRAQATPDFTLYVERGFYFIGGALYEWTGGNSAAFTVPAGTPVLPIRRCDLLYIGSDQALHIVQGATTSDGSVPAYPTTPYPCIPIAYVYLTSGMTSIEEDNIKDARVILTASDGTPVAHNLLSSIHGDTLAASVVAGDLIIGNDTPKWSRLAITVPAANVRNVVGVDNGETKPSWKVALDGTTPADIAGTAGAGTSLVFAHRDHVHRGVVSVNKNGDTTLYGTVTLSAGANITLTQVGQDIAIAASGGAGAHDILSATHGDTLADTVVDGDVIIGNATPKWSRLAISVPAANVRNVLGIDNAETRPSWKAALDSTNPVTLTVSTVAAPGTSLVFAHRDHAHAITSSSNPGAAASLLATDVSGIVRVAGLAANGLLVSNNASVTSIASNNLTIAAADDASASFFIKTFGTAPYPYQVLAHYRGTAGTPSATQLGDYLGQFGWGGYRASLSSGITAALTAVASENWTNTRTGTYIIFSTVDDASTTLTERMRLNENGRLDIEVSMTLGGGATYTTISSAPGAAASILATDASGDVAVQAVSTGSTATKWGSGTAFPGSPATNDRFFRTDLGWLCYYDGTRWLTANEYSFLQEIPPYTAFAANGDTYFGTFRTDYAPYITRIAANTYVPATNDGSNYWTILTRGANLAVNAWTTIDSFTTAADTASTRTLHEHAPSATATPANNQFIEINVTKTAGAPGNLTININVFYRLIVT